jgi:predicted DNA-binding transcriptional regulator AlpA
MSAEPVRQITPTIHRNARRRCIPPGLLRRKAAARYLDVGTSTLDRLNAAGLVPKPIRLGGSLAWPRAELAAWIAHGCPQRAEWSPLWSAIVARRTGRVVTTR